MAKRKNPAAVTLGRLGGLKERRWTNEETDAGTALRDRPKSGDGTVEESENEQVRRALCGPQKG
jgi:hypothetical protein